MWTLYLQMCEYWKMISLRDLDALFQWLLTVCLVLEGLPPKIVVQDGWMSRMCQGTLWERKTLQNTSTVLKVTSGGKSHIIPMARRRYGEVTSGSRKLHQGRRITMAQPVSSILGDVVKSSRSIAHSDDFEGRKLIQTNSRQLILLDLNILYWCPAPRDQIKPRLVQPQISCNASRLAVANPIGRAMI